MIAYASRATVFLPIGWLNGYLGERIRRYGREAAVLARHFEVSHDLLCRATFEGYFVQLNDAWEETLGWTKEELMSRPFVEFVHPDDRERTRDRNVNFRAGRPTDVGFTNRYRTEGRRLAVARVELADRQRREADLRGGPRRDRAAGERAGAERGGGALPEHLRGFGHRHGGDLAGRGSQAGGPQRGAVPDRRPPA